MYSMGGEGEVAQTMYAHVSKCKTIKEKGEKKKYIYPSAGHRVEMAVSPPSKWEAQHHHHQKNVFRELFDLLPSRLYQNMVFVEFILLVHHKHFSPSI
jgi:hypothetical protein